MHVKKLSNFFPKLDFDSAGKKRRNGDLIWSWFEYAVFHRRTRYFQHILSILDRVANDNNCSYALEKMKEIGNFRNVDAFLSECKFAQKYLDMNYNVDFVLDNDSRFTGKTPDLIVSKDDNVAWIEVRTAGETDRLASILIEDLRQICPLLQKPHVEIWFQIDYEYEDIWKDINSLIRLVNEAISKFHEVIKKNDYQLAPGKYQCGIVTYKVKPFSGNKSTVFGGGPRDIFEIPLAPFEQLIGKILKEKAKKSRDWKDKINYYIGLDFQQSYNEVDDLVTVLYGKAASWRKEFLEVPGWKFDDSIFPEVESALKRGWDRNFLKSLFLIPNNLTRIEKKGLFFTNSDSEEISGFLSIFRFDKGKVYVLPNPFAKEERENRNYEWLGVLAKSS